MTLQFESFKQDVPWTLLMFTSVAAWCRSHIRTISKLRVSYMLVAWPAPFDVGSGTEHSQQCTSCLQRPAIGAALLQCISPVHADCICQRYCTFKEQMTHCEAQHTHHAAHPQSLLCKAGRQLPVCVCSIDWVNKVGKIIIHHTLCISTGSGRTRTVFSEGNNYQQDVLHGSPTKGTVSTHTISPSQTVFIHSHAQ